MKQIIPLIFIFSLVNIYGQDTAEVSIPFFMFDNGGGQNTLYLGFDSTATDSIDENLGESDLPPFPPTGVFETRWTLPANGFDGSLSSYKDYRNGGGAILGDTIEYRLKYQGSSDADTMYFSWDFPPEISAFMQDLVTGTIINVNMNGTGVYGLYNFGALNQMKLLVYYNIIPVELTSFTANVIGNNVILNWETATETNTKGFAIERSEVNNSGSGNTIWQEIGYIAGAGTTTEPQLYTFIDENVLSGRCSYRLKMIDFNGIVEYSKEIEINANVQLRFLLDQNYPNPFNPTTMIKFSIAKETFVNLSVYNSLGERVMELKNEIMSPGNYEIDFDGTTLTSGVYLYKIKAGDFIQMKKMMLLK